MKTFTVAVGMAAFEHNEETEEVKMSKENVKVPTTLASIESLTFPQVLDIIFSVFILFMGTFLFNDQIC